MPKTTGYISAWLRQNAGKIRDSEWFNDCVGDGVKEIDPNFFIENYVIPTLESNIEYDFGASMDARKLFR